MCAERKWRNGRFDEPRMVAVRGCGWYVTCRLRDGAQRSSFAMKSGYYCLNVAFEGPENDSYRVNRNIALSHK